MNNLQEVICIRGQTVFEAAIAAGYDLPTFRIGIVPDNPPRDGEVLVARVKTQSWQMGFPIFQCPEGQGGEQDERMEERVDR